MKKWKKIQKSLIRKWRQTQCDWFGHQPVTVIEERWRGKQNILNRKGGKPRKGGHYVYGNQSILYQKILEAEIPVLCSYLGVLETARREALADERYEDVQRLIETIRYNTGTLEQLRREYSMMRKDSQSTR